MPHYTYCENALEKAVVPLHPNEQKRSSGTPVRTMPTSQNRDMGHPVLWLGGGLRPTLSTPPAKLAGTRFAMRLPEWGTSDDPVSPAVH